MWCFIFLLCSINLSLGYCAPCAYPRICSNCAAAICSNCAAACFHILGFIAREHCDRGDPVIIKSRIRAWHNLLDCHATLAMTEVLLFLDHSDHPAAARHPSNGGELGTVLYFFTYSAMTPVEPLGGELGTVLHFFTYSAATSVEPPGGGLGAVLYFSHCGRRGISRYCAFRTAIIAHAL